MLKKTLGKLNFKQLLFLVLLTQCQVSSAISPHVLEDGTVIFHQFYSRTVAPSSSVSVTAVPISCHRDDSVFGAVTSTVTSVSDVLDVVEAPDLSSIKDECSTSFYLGLIAQGAVDPPDSQVRLWQSIENHDIRVPDVVKSPISLIPSPTLSRLIEKNGDCENACKSTTLNKIYESFLAKQIVQTSFSSDKLNLKPLYEKISGKLHEKLGDRAESEEITWADNPKILNYPLSQKFRHPRDTNLTKLRTLSELPIFLDFFVGYYGFKRVPSSTEAPSSELRDGTPVESTLKRVQDLCYNERLSRYRGPRTILDEKLPEIASRKSNQLGLATEMDIPALRLHDDDVPWLHPSRRIDISTDESEFRKHTLQRHIPMVTGISGNTNIGLFSLLSLNINLNPTELRLYVLSLWSTLCSDGGHSLQEVLTSMRIVSDFLQENDVASHVPGSRETIASLKEITKELSIDGVTPPGGLFGSYHEAFFKHLEADYPPFRKAREAAQAEFLDYFRSSGCQ